jgi:ribose transport system permease protein
LRNYVRQNSEAIRFLLPSLVLLILVVAATTIMLRGQLSWLPYLNSMLVLGSFLAVLGLGQGTVVLSGGLDLSLPAAITLAGVLLTGFAGGSDVAALWAIPLILVGAAAIGAINGFAVALLGVSPFIMTLAMNGILFGASLLYCNGTPYGVSPPVLAWLMTGRLLGFTPVVFGLVILAIGGSLLLSRSVFGRQLIAIGNTKAVAKYAGVPVERTIIAAYALSTVCAAVTGLLLVGFSGQAFNDMGDPYLLPSIAVVVLGGSRIAGGRGSYVGILSGALAITVISALLSSLMVPQATRDIIFGVVILAAVLGMREK